MTNTNTIQIVGNVDGLRINAELEFARSDKATVVELIRQHASSSTTLVLTDIHGRSIILAFGLTRVVDLQVIDTVACINRLSSECSSVW